jgi:hypothetical protein
MRIRQSHLSLTLRVLELRLRLANGKAGVATHSVILDSELSHTAVEELVS